MLAIANSASLSAYSEPLDPAWLQTLSEAAWPTSRITHVIAITSPIGCNTKIVAGIFDMLNFMIMSLQELATACNNFRGALLFYFIAARASK